MSEKEETERSEVTVHARFFIEFLGVEGVFGKRGSGDDASVFGGDFAEGGVEEALGDISVLVGDVCGAAEGIPHAFTIGKYLCFIGLVFVHCISLMG